MGIIRAIKCDLDKAVINIGFVGAVFMAMLLCFTAVAYVDPNTSKSYTVFEAMLTLDRNIIRQDNSFASVYVFRLCLSGYITMFIPIITAFPFMVTFCAERNSGLMRFTISRTGKIRYFLSKFVSCTVSAGLAVMLGVMLYGIIVCASFPNISSYGIDGEQLKHIFPNGIIPFVMKILAAAFVYGAVSVMPAFFISSFCKNPYLITCVPFLLIYLWDTALEKVYFSFIDADRWEELGKLTPYYPNSVVSGVVYSYDDNTGRNIIIFNSVYVLALLAAFIVIMNSRKDKGV